jgi:hypothetical protein
MVQFAPEQRNPKGGRPVGRPDKLTEVRKELAQLGKDAKPPREVLLELMVDSHRKYRRAKAVLDFLDAAKVRNRAEFNSAYERWVAAHNLVREDALAVIPYCHPKLAAVAMEVEQTTTFVIRAPEVASSPEEWIKSMAKASGATIDGTLAETPKKKRIRLQGK